MRNWLSDTFGPRYPLDEWSATRRRGFGEYAAPLPPAPPPLVPHVYVRDGAYSVQVPVDQVTRQDEVWTDAGWQPASWYLRTAPVAHHTVNVSGEAEFSFVPPRARFRGYSLLGSFLALAGLIVVWHAAPVIVATLL